MNTMNSVNNTKKTTLSTSQTNKTPARAINFVGNKNKTEDRKTVEVASAAAAAAVALAASVAACCGGCCCLFLISTHAYKHAHTYMRETATTARLASSASAERSEP